MDTIKTYSISPVHYFRERLIVPPEPHDPFHHSQGEFTIGEKDSRIVNIRSDKDPNLSSFTGSGGVIYPHIAIGHLEANRERNKFISAKKSSSFRKSIQKSWQNFVHNCNKSTILRYTVVPILNIFNINENYGTLNLPDSLKIPEDIPIRCFAWHKHKQKFAVALQDNTIRIYDLVSETWFPLVLQHEFQIDIQCMEWRPFSGNTLAVGCKYGVCVWNILSKDIRKDSSFVDVEAWMNFLKYPGVAPVNTISWSPKGNFLAVGSINCNYTIIWDVDIEQPTQLSQILVGGVTKVLWSPNGYYLFASSSSNMFRVWETQYWTCEKWTNFNSYCQCATWSSEGNHLTFAENNDSIVYIIRFNIIDSAIQGIVVKLLDFSPYEVQLRDGRKIDAGGIINHIRWDGTNSRLLVSFENSELIASLQCNSISKDVNFYPFGYFRGPYEGKSVLSMEFCPNFPRGALLAVCWFNGKISLYPMYFVPVNKIKT